MREFFFQRHEDSIYVYIKRQLIDYQKRQNQTEIIPNMEYDFFPKIGCTVDARIRFEIICTI